MLALDIARCIGAPAGPSGHQTREECHTCARRQAPRFPDSSYVEPEKEPCPNRIPVEASRDLIDPEKLYQFPPQMGASVTRVRTAGAKES